MNDDKWHAIFVVVAVVLGLSLFAAGGWLIHEAKLKKYEVCMKHDKLEHCRGILHE